MNNKNSYLESTGWLNSLRKGAPLDSYSNPIPWMNFSVIDFLDERLNQSLRLFEYGSGYSTTFYAHRVSTITSLEYDKNWLETVRSQVPINVDLLFNEQDTDGRYCRTILDQDVLFNVIIIDGRDRVNCVKQCLHKLTTDGVVILDDSLRERYLEAFKFLEYHDFRHINFTGLKPQGTGIDRTTIFYRQQNCFNI